MSRWGDFLRDPEPAQFVGAVPGQQEATATADYYTYGAFSEALSQGQAMAAWADLQAKQNVARQSTQSLGPMTCPNGFLISLPNSRGQQTCVNERNAHVAMRWQAQCDSSKTKGSEYESLWFRCSILPRWFELHHPVALRGYSSSPGEARKMLPAALRDLGLLAPGRWGDVRAEIHALARAMFFTDADAGIRDRTEKSVEDELVNSAAPIYDAAVAKGGDVPAWVGEQIGYDQSGESGLAGWLLLGGLGALGVYVGAPSVARSALSKLQQAGGAVVRKAKGAV